eukprot:scaffold1967_cov199-Alexandrium_tamarense.AAC.69
MSSYKLALSLTATKQTMSHAINTSEPTTLLDHVRSLVKAEQGLTEALEKSQPLLAHTNSRHHLVSSSSVLTSQTDPPLLPTPRNMDEVQTILAVARAYSVRTSAPPMWNPRLPVIGFATPNPLPHQLRGGALGDMQLKMAREEKKRKSNEVDERRENERSKKLKEEEMKRAQSAKEQLDEDDAMDVDRETSASAGKRKREEEPVTALDPKKLEMLERQRRQASNVSASNGQIKRQQSADIKANKEAANMNLSDSSSSDEGSDDESD